MCCAITFATFGGSSYNSSSQYTFCDVFAPANDMFGMCHYDNKLYDGGWDGTSFASPQVAGLAALYFEKYPTRSAADFEKDLYNSCVQFSSGSITKSQLGHGRIDASRLLGVSLDNNVEVKIKSNWTNVKAYLYNSISGSQKSAWPGDNMTKDGDYYVASYNNNNYDFIIFSNSTQTINISLCAFSGGAHYLNLINSSTSNSLLLGRWTKL